VTTASRTNVSRRSMKQHLATILYTSTLSPGMHEQLNTLDVGFIVASCSLSPIDGVVVTSYNCGIQGQLLLDEAHRRRPQINRNNNNNINIIIISIIINNRTVSIRATPVLHRHRAAFS